MKCPQLAHHNDVICRAGGETYKPSPFQLEEYCRSKNHEECPFYVHFCAGKGDTTIDQ